MLEPNLAMSEALPAQQHALPPEFKRVVQALCDTYESLDLHIETTLAAAERDFIAALPEMVGHEEELRSLVALLLEDIHRLPKNTRSSMILLHLAFEDEGDLADQVLSSLEARGDTL